MSRLKKQAKTELNQLVKSIENRMSDFETAVQDLKDLKETLSEVDDEIIARAAINAQKIEEMNRGYADNKIKMVNTAVKELGKVIITREELDELRSQVEKVKTESMETIATEVASHKKSLDEKTEQALKVQTLQHECETAQLNAEAEAHKKEVLNLKDNLERMVMELKSQKKLTADLAGANRPQQQTQAQAPQ